MTDPTVELFERLGRRGHVPTLEKVRGLVRFDIGLDRHFEHWLVAIDNGDISVSQEMRDADCIVQTDKGLFDQVATGRENAITALLRGAMQVNGRLDLLVLLERLLPGPPGARDPREDRRERAGS